MEVEIPRNIHMTDDNLFKTPTLKRKTNGRRRGKSKERTVSRKTDKGMDGSKNFI